MPFDWLKSLRPSSRSSRRRRPALLSSSLDPCESRTLLSAAPVGPETQVNTDTTNHQYTPAVAMDADGDYAVTWFSEGQDGSSSGIYARLFRAGGTPLSADFKINTYTTGSQIDPDIAMDDDGDFVIVWQSSGQDSSGTGIYAQRYSAAGTPLGEFKVNTFTTGNQYTPAVAMDADGDFVITWTSDYQDDGPTASVQAQRYNRFGIAQGTEFRVNTYTTNYQWHPDVAMDDTGDFVITWDSSNQDGSGYGVYAQRYNAAGTPQGQEFRVNTTTEGYQFHPSVAINSQGDFVIAWEDEISNNPLHVYARRFNAAGNPQGFQLQVSSEISSLPTVPQIAMSDDGAFVVSWDSSPQDGNGSGIYARHYTPDGLPETSPFQVNTTTTDNQSYSAVTMDADGDFIIAWDSTNQDSGTRGIYHQRYRASHAAYVGSWRTGSFFLDSNHSDNYDGSTDDSLFGFGSTTDKPVAGDWNGDGYDDIGVWRAGTFYLDANGNGLWDGSSIDRTFPFGISTDTPVIGDWNRDGKDEVGVWRAGRFFLDLNGNRILDPAPTDAVFSFGAATDTPIAGDWNGDGYDDIGTWRAGRFFLDLNGNRKWDRPAFDSVFFFGISTDKPVVGDWNADGIDDVGVWRSRQFWVDYNGNRFWDGPENEYIIDFGNTTDTPLVGYWRPKTTPGNPPLPALPPTTSPATPKPASASTPLASLLSAPRRKLHF